MCIKDWPRNGGARAAKVRRRCSFLARSWRPNVVGWRSVGAAMELRRGPFGVYLWRSLGQGEKLSKQTRRPRLLFTGAHTRGPHTEAHRTQRHTEHAEAPLPLCVWAARTHRHTNNGAQMMITSDDNAASCRLASGRGAGPPAGLCCYLELAIECPRLLARRSKQLPQAASWAAKSRP